MELDGRFSERRTRMPTPPPGTSYFHSPGYAALDLYVHWEFTENLRFNLGISNLTDRRYWAAGDIPLAPGTSAVLDRYTAPGRALSAAVALEW